jgi:hypothetical protein
VTDPRDDDLRALLDDAVSDVDPPGALHHIRARTHSQSSQKVVPMNNKRPWILAAVGAVAATAATLVAVTVITDDDPVTTSGPASPSASATAEESDEPTAEPSAETDAPSASPAGETTSVPVYYVGETRGSVRLFREFHRLEKESVEAAQVSGALAEALTDSALDPDYRSDWPEGTSVSGVNIDGVTTNDAVWIDLTGSDLRDRPAGMSQEEATMAVQQLVHTAQAVLQKRHPIEFMVDGEPVDTLLGEPVAERAIAGNPMEVQAPVWIISPQEGDTVGTTFVVDGRGIFFEANVSWQLLQDGEVVDEGFTTAQDGMSLASYSFEVTAEPGDYVLRVYDADMSGGEGNGEAEDTKAITVE